MASIAQLEEIYEHQHSAQQVAPSGAGAVVLTSAGGAWTLGAASADIIAAGAVALPFDIHWIEVSDPDTNAEYEIVLYYGAGDTECARIAFTRSNVQTRSKTLPVQTPILPAGSRVRAKLMDSAGGSVANIKIFYHAYD